MFPEAAGFCPADFCSSAEGHKAISACRKFLDVSG
jgi:hypothetical protein